jgi:hypothetical protein
MLVAEGRIPKCKIDGSAGFLVTDLTLFAEGSRQYMATSYIKGGPDHGEYK